MSEPMTGAFRVGLAQMCTGRDVEKNLLDASTLIREAARQGAHYVQTPEITTLMEMDRARLFAAVRPQEGNAAIAHFGALARELGIWLHVGSMAILLANGQIANRSFLISPAGEIEARCDKIHMFDVALPGGESYRESKNYAAGDRAVLAQLPWGTIGLTVCYDLRFPHLYRALAKAGARYLTIPSSFQRATGKVHWHTLVKARAIENACFVFAPAMCGEHPGKRTTYGHSLIVDPWGEVLADGGDNPGIVFADIDPQRVDEVRGMLPSLEHDRAFSVQV